MACQLPSLLGNTKPGELYASFAALWPSARSNMCRLVPTHGEEIMHRRRQNKPRKSAFVTTVAVAATIATVAAGCNGGVTTNPPPPKETVCPETTPEDGASCGAFTDGLECNYEVECERVDKASCGQDGRWEVESSVTSCNPPAPLPCPDELPRTGDDCSPTPVQDIPQGCAYTVSTSCGEQTLTPTCKPVNEGGDTTHVWVVEAPSCAGDAIDCTTYQHPDLCAADAACQYLRPGCASEMQEVAPEGCFPASDCTVGSCGAGATCTPVVSNPCPALIPGEPVCGACGVEVAVCLSSD